MVINNISFNDELCLKMTKKEFIKAHVDFFFLDKTKEERDKILSDAYDLMNNKIGRTE